MRYRWSILTSLSTAAFCLMSFAALLPAQESGAGQASTNTGAGSAPATAGPTTGGTPGGLPGGNTGIPGGNRPNNPFPSQDRLPDFDRMENRPIFLSGKVMMEDGGPPQESAVIERICMGRGSPIQEAYTDSKGRFSFQVGQRMGMMQDASVGNSDEGFGSRPGMGQMGNMGGNMPRVSERDLQMCELRASLPGYRSTVVSLAGRRSLDNPDVGTIIMRRLADVSGFTTSATTMMAPKDAKKAFEKAKNALKKNKLPEAQKELEIAVSLHPKFAEAHHELAQVYLMSKNNEAARAGYEKAIEADPKFISPYLGIANLEAQQQKWDAVKAMTEKVLQMNRYDFPAAYFYGAVANYNLRDAEAAEKLCRAGIEIDQYHRIPKMSHLLGVLLAEKQDYKGASESLQSYLKFAPKAGDAENVKKQLAELQGRLAQTAPPQN